MDVYRKIWVNYGHNLVEVNHDTREAIFQLQNSDKGAVKSFQVRHWEMGEDKTFRSDTGVETRPQGGDKTFLMRHWEMGDTRLPGQTLGNGRRQDFRVRHWEIGDTRLSGQTLGEFLRSDTGRISQVRHWERQYFQVRPWGRLGNGGDKTLRSDAGKWRGQDFQVRHWEDFSGLTVGNWEDRTFLVKHGESFSGQTLGNGGDYLRL